MSFMWLLKNSLFFAYPNPNQAERALAVTRWLGDRHLNRSPSVAALRQIEIQFPSPNAFPL
jgi:hypothetical protein